ncbi:MAG: glutamine--fructose-6-phosphate transaminase (isomerizing) [Planctomycetes bacterium]|nr:glutamine--fructose-6-phosphate transaminase (isomerizing) [Planctomycetota bacterium]
MCGIVGCICKRDATRVLLRGLARLEYRGYDSAGVAVLSADGEIAVRRRVGKLIHLQDALEREPIGGTTGIGHTRWATHGGVSEQNAHPHLCYEGNLAVIHNGIIENYATLKAELRARGRVFRSETDTEVLAFLIAEARHTHTSLRAAVVAALTHVQGAYALVVIDRREPETLVCARNQSPLVIGLRDGEAYLASDVPALLEYTRDVIFLKDEEVAELGPGHVALFTLAGQPVAPAVTRIQWDLHQAEKSGYAHFMLKEIHEQPRVLTETLLGRIGTGTEPLCTDGGEPLITPARAARLQRVVLVACGTSWHAGLVAAFWFEALAGLPVQVDYASELRYRRAPLGPDTLVVAVSQSGETADTLAAVKEARRRGAHCLAVVNAVGSSLTRETDGVLYTRAGPEIGVASTKAFTTQLAALLLLAASLGRTRGREAERAAALLAALRGIAEPVQRAIAAEPAIQEAAARLAPHNDFLYLGRGVNYPVALEGALKLKEISYIHAEGYPAGEMKHGPIALIDAGFPVVCIATPGAVYEKMLSNLEEVKARRGRIVVVAAQGDTRVGGLADTVLPVPEVPEELSPIVNVVPLQLLAYHIALGRGCDIDQPRNLAKSVTVE